MAATTTMMLLVRPIGDIVCFVVVITIFVFVVAVVVVVLVVVVVAVAVVVVGWWVGRSVGRLVG